MAELAKLILEAGILTVIGALFIKQSQKLFNKMIERLDQDSKTIKSLEYQFIKTNSKLTEIDDKLTNNKNGLRISINAVIFEEKSSLKLSLFDIINHNHFKDDIEYLKTKLDNSVNKFKTDLHSKLFQMTLDRNLVNSIDTNVNINESIKNIFITEIEKDNTDYEFLKNRIESFLKKMRTNLIDIVYKYYEEEEE